MRKSIKKFLLAVIFIIAAVFIIARFAAVKHIGKQEPETTISEIEEETEYQAIEGTIARGNTLAGVLQKNHISPDQTYRIINALRKVFNVRKCNIGDGWQIVLNGQGEFIAFTYRNGPLDYFTVTYNTEKDVYEAAKQRINAKEKTLGARGKIQSSLYESMCQLGVPAEFVIQFAEIFASKIDFFTDCRRDDEFSIIWNSYVYDGEVLEDIRILAAQYKNTRSDYYAFYFKNGRGSGGYYDNKGHSVESAFLKAPLSYRRISSHFSYRRFHPILRRYRPHLGIDYAAPRGTPISAIGNGTVILSGWTTKGYGIAVKVKHPNGYISYYGHLSKIRKGIRKGCRVSKGQVIGYVGSTGISTGPHLDFRLNKNGKFVNFLNLKLPPCYPLPKSDMPEFNAAKAVLEKQLRSIPDEQVLNFSDEKQSDSITK